MGEGIYVDIGRRVGVLLPASILRRIVRNKPTWESAVEYAAAAKRLNLELVLFSLNGYSPHRKSVRGYVWRSTEWHSWKGPLPQVVHNRVLPTTLGSIHLVRLLARQLDRGLFNPVVSRDKWYVWQQLVDSEEIKDHLPPTWPLSRQLCRKLPDLMQEHECMVIKPRHGSLGSGIVFIERVSGRRPRYRLIPTKGRSRVVGTKPLIRLIHHRRARRSYIIQDTVPLVTYQDRRCDMRVPVQRDGHGKWRVITAAIKQAKRHQYVTNIALGGEAHAYRPVLEAIFGAHRASAIWADINRLSLAVAKRLTKCYPQLADLGLDIGIDAAGQPWLVAVNFRDQHLPSKKAGQVEAHAQLYHNPIAYANYLICHPQGGDS